MERGVIVNHLAINRYLIYLPPIGNSLYATVHRAYDIENTRIVVVKSTTNIIRGRSEAMVMKRYGRHNYLPTLYDFFLYEKAAYIVMEYCKGKTLGTNFDRKTETVYTERHSLAIVGKILIALQRLHSSGYAHKDTKPKNVIIQDGNPEGIKLVDFNTSSLVTEYGIQSDLQNAAKMYIYLTNGIVPNPIEKAVFRNQEIRSAVLKAFNKTYGSAKEFYNELTGRRLRTRYL